MITSDDILSRISSLSPREFESFSFECMRAIGMRNLVWRTPGADGGRDIEGEVYVRDVSGYEERQVWYIECKLYSRSIEWSVIWKKLAYADSLNVDVLFLVTNNNPSPQAESRIASWNKQKKKPAIRVWRGYEFPPFLRCSPSISASYGLIDKISDQAVLLRPLTDIIVGLSQSAYSRRVFDQDPLAELETIAALSELLAHRLNDLARFGKFMPGPRATRSPEFRWLHIVGSTLEWEDVSLRALTTFVHHQMRCEQVHLTADGPVAHMRVLDALSPFDPYTSASMSEILTWARCELLPEDSDGVIGAMQRK